MPVSVDKGDFLFISSLKSRTYYIWFIILNLLFFYLFFLFFLLFYYFLSYFLHIFFVAYI